MGPRCVPKPDTDADQYQIKQDGDKHDKQTGSHGPGCSHVELECHVGDKPVRIADAQKACEK